MKNRQEIFGLITNITLVVLLFCFIVAGLNIIGIYDLPKPIEKILGTNDEDDASPVGDDSQILDEVSFDENVTSFEIISLDYKNANNVLENLVPKKTYVQKINVLNRYGDKIRKEIINIVKNEEATSVEFFDEAGKITKSIIADENITSITEFYSDASQSVEIPNGLFSIYEECGYILTVDDFLKSDFELGDANFNQFEDSGKVFITVSFDNNKFGKLQNVKYVISLDFGVVTEAYCYEGGELVYEMITEQLLSGE